MNVSAKPQASFKLEPVHPKPEEAHTMPYAPAVRIVGACDLMFLSGATPSPLYHKHPHVDAEHVHPHSIEEQTDARDGGDQVDPRRDRRQLARRGQGDEIPDRFPRRRRHARHHGQVFRRLAAGLTTVCINSLSSPGARIELDMIVALPKKA